MAAPVRLKLFKEHSYSARTPIHHNDLDNLKYGCILRLGGGGNDCAKCFY